MLVPPGSTVKYVEHASGRLRVLHGGLRGRDRWPVVLVHGGGSDNSGISWYRLIEPLSRDREVWAIDLPGFGGSMDAAPAGGPKAIADVLADVTKSLHIGPAVVFGVSMGGDVVLNFALRYPRLVAGLVLIAPGGLAPIFRNRIVHRSAWLVAQAPDWLLLPATRLANRFVKAVLRSMVEDPATVPPQVMEEFAREARRPRAGIGYVRYNQSTLGPRNMLNDLTDRVWMITAPALLFHGDNDPIVDPESSRRAAEQMPGARRVGAPHCGHWAQL